MTLDTLLANWLYHQMDGIAIYDDKCLIATISLEFRLSRLHMCLSDLHTYIVVLLSFALLTINNYMSPKMMT